ncbi:hypothetical protein [Lacticaseibacillus parakribbianus]|uniref:hypothetical protein n=1 Tax=Lacticaseibacillus parakribbianus TaxID=2970927 RepID=UPI0021CB646B|nr:hypothetical protein [Lacticaseibacillus parakribbianus]
MLNNQGQRPGGKQAPVVKVVAGAIGLLVVAIGPVIDFITYLVTRVDWRGLTHVTKGGGGGTAAAHPAAIGLLLGAAIALLGLLVLRSVRPHRAVRTTYRPKPVGYTADHPLVQTDRTPRRARAGAVALGLALVIAVGLLALVLLS